MSFLPPEEGEAYKHANMSCLPPEEGEAYKHVDMSCLPPEEGEAYKHVNMSGPLFWWETTHIYMFICLSSSGGKQLIFTCLYASPYSGGRQLIFTCLYASPSSGGSQLISTGLYSIFYSLRTIIVVPFNE
jgi:hypothetical protein